MSEKSIQFMNKVIEAEPWVLQVLKEGVRLEFFCTPPLEYAEDNNKSALTEMTFLRGKYKNG